MLAKAAEDRSCRGKLQLRPDNRRLFTPRRFTVQSKHWQFWVDRGGTFTDIVATDPDGRMHTLKLLSDNPAQYADAVIEGIRRLTALDAAHGRVESIKIGTTVATNALLERRGEPTALVITSGLGDSIRIGTQQRPDIFALDIALPEMLYGHVIEAQERVSASGDIIVPLDEGRLRADLTALVRAGIKSVAIVFLHSYRFPEHERRAAAIARETGFRQVSASHDISPLIKLVPRGQTTLLDAYLSPVLNRYIESLHVGLGSVGGAGELLFMQSHGGLATADAFHGKDSVLSGPAGGVVGMSRAAAQAGFKKVIGFDMGGTSTDVSLFDGRYQRTTDTVIGGVRITTPMMGIYTVASGGGSIIKYAQRRLQSGPESAGADPGPACYRNGGPLTITDANVLLGRIRPDFFPNVFGECADQPIDAGIVEHKFRKLAAKISADTGQALDGEAVADGALKIAIERMTNAVKKISVKQGHDLSEYALCSFGGAGGQHACLVAEALGIETVLIHPHSGVLSAYGIGVADLRTVRQQGLNVELDRNSLIEIRSIAKSLNTEAATDMATRGRRPITMQTELRLRLKSLGSDSTIAIICDDRATATDLKNSFRQAHRDYYGFDPESVAVVVDSIECETIGEVDEPDSIWVPNNEASGLPECHRRVWIDGHWQEAPIYVRRNLLASTTVVGPAIIVEENATTVVESRWSAKLDPSGILILSESNGSAARSYPPISGDTTERRVEPDPVLLEVFNNLFMYAAEQMGNVLENTAHSVNIKERKDFSCAIFDTDGDLIANAPHMPVHLGSMGDSVRQVLDHHRKEFADGDVYMSNAPYSGGTHLPDITVISPVFEQGALEFLVASRAHHADVGGATPGSMPPLSTTIFEEGVLIEDVRIVEQGRLLNGAAAEIFTSGRYPARNPTQNIADLKAQIAANARGAAELHRITTRFGLGTVREYMQHIKNNAEYSVRRAIQSLRSGNWTVSLDSGDRIAIEISIDRSDSSALIDFSGTSPTSRSNFNAPSAVARSAVLYVFRCLVDEDIPLNGGCMTPLHVRIPEATLVNPDFPAAVVAGNVETSQCIADALFAALGVMASSQGTMNNFTFGNDELQYYETLCGGAGATRNADGASAVHTHMTNSTLTDPEVLEWRFPVRLSRFAIRTGSGGNGRRRGGDGIIREIEFLEPMDAAILSNNRMCAPFGLDGGNDGAPGKNYVIRKTGQTDHLGAVAQTQMAAGDRFVIETPGGGGYGRRRDN